MKELILQLWLYEIAVHHSQTAFKKLYEALYDRLFRTAYYYLHCDEWAQEVVLDVFLGLWNRREELNGIKQFDSYCFILVKNASLNYLAKEERRTITLSLEESTEPFSLANSPEDELLSEELLQVYLRVLDELPSRCREVFLLVREEKKSYAEVAMIMQISPKTVDAHLQKAISRLKERLNFYLLQKE